MVTVIERAKDLHAQGDSGPVSAAAIVRARAAHDGGLYKPRTPIYPKLVHGRWRTIKWTLLIVTLTIYYVTPWLRWTRPPGMPQQAVLVDFAGPRFYFFFIQLWPQEVYFFTGLLVMAALGLFLTTALFGRLWCGYACPQTVWTDLFIVVERLFEGDRNARMKLDAQPMSIDKAWRKGGKHLTWLLIAMATGGAWVFYFHDAPSLWRSFWIGQAPDHGLCLRGASDRHHLRPGRDHARAGLHLSLPLAADPGRDDRRGIRCRSSTCRTAANRAGRTRRASPGRGAATASTASNASSPAPWASTSATATSSNASIAACASTPATRSWSRVERPRGLIGYDTDAAVRGPAGGPAARLSIHQATDDLLRRRTCPCHRA